MENKLVYFCFYFKWMDLYTANFTPVFFKTNFQLIPADSML